MERLEPCVSTVMQDRNNDTETTGERQTRIDLCLARVERMSDTIIGFALRIGIMTSLNQER